jgi:hypothetical protein
MSKLPLFTAPQDAADGEFHWFVYGSSLDFEALAAWCGEHGYHVPDLSRAEPARLRGWRLAFNVPSRFWGGLAASLIADPASSVEGILIPVPGTALGFVRHREGVLSGLYQEHEATADSFAGASRPCRVYVAAPGRAVEPGAPAARYRETLLKGARARGLSDAWVETLARA